MALFLGPIDKYGPSMHCLKESGRTTTEAFFISIERQLRMCARRQGFQKCPIQLCLLGEVKIKIHIKLNLAAPSIESRLNLMKIRNLTGCSLRSFFIETNIVLIPG